MKTVKIKSAIPIYLAALTWILFGLFAPIYELIFIIIAACVSLAVYLVASVFIPGRTVEVEAAPDSGDKQVDRQIAEAAPRCAVCARRTRPSKTRPFPRASKRMTDAVRKFLTRWKRTLRAPPKCAGS